MTSEIRLFTPVTVAKAESVVANPNEPADPEGDGGFAEWAMLTLHALRIELGKSYRVAVDLLSEMPGVPDEIAHDALQPGATYRIAILEGPEAVPEEEPVTHDPAATPAPRDPPGPPVEEGEVRLVTIETVGDQGDGIAKVDRGYVVIVPETEPGAQPRVCIDEVRENLAFATVVDE